MQLFEHQKELLRFHFDHPNSLDLSEVGVGKTAPAIQWLTIVMDRGDVHRTLVVCPNSVTQNWQDELVKWSRLSSVILRGPKEKRLELLSKAYSVYIINFEGIRTIFDALMAREFDAIIVDEAHHIKSYRAQVTKLLLKLSKRATYRKALTGTVLTNNIEDLWSICSFVDPAIFDHMNFWAYRSRYLYNDNAGKSWMNYPKWLPKPRAAEEIKEKLTPHAIRFEKREVMKWLPPVLFQKRYVDLSDEQSRVYRDLKKHFVAELEGNRELAALHVLSRMMKLLEITSGFAYQEDAPPYRFKRNAKIEELKNVLEEIGDQRAVIWGTFKEDVKIIRDALYDKFYSTITGDTPADTRQTIIDEFHLHNTGYLICNPACAGEGLTLLAPYFIYYSRSYKLGERIQSLGRGDRPGAEVFDNITVIDLVARDSVDERVMMALESKEDLLKTINPKNFREMFV